MSLSSLILSPDAQKLVRLAQECAVEHSHGQYGPEHLLWAAMSEDIGLRPFLSDVSADATAVRRWALTRIEKGKKDHRHIAKPKPTEEGTQVYAETQRLLIRYGHDEVTPLDLLEALVSPGVGFDEAFLRRLPIALYEIIEWRNEHGNVGSTSTANGSSASSGGSGSTATPSEGSQLQTYCENLNEQAREDRIDPVVGRDREMKQLIEILGKRISPNVMIVGEPGVGKTSIVGGLANLLVAGEVPEKLKDATLYELDLSGRLVAGAFKGEVEERMKSILKEIKAAEHPVILFIDEIHILLDERGPVGAGVVNLLKPDLARGEITVIGATTQSEFQKHIEKDSAFNRRFSKLTIEEPTELVAIQMLEGLVSKYEDFHGIQIGKEALTTSVFLAKKYIKDKHLPASAIELMDFTMSCANQMNSSSAAVLEKIASHLDTEDPVSVGNAISELKNQLSELLLGRMEEKDWSSSNLTDTMEKLKALTAEAKETIEQEDIESIAAYKSGIPIGSMRANEQEKLQNAEAILSRRVVGQDHVVEAVVRGLKTFRANLKEPNDPGAIFFFTGPTGTGKTELAKSIAELLFDDENAMLRFDMSEFQESHSVATLLGAPPGYAGYDEGGILVNNVRKKPYSVVLFDEIEKAHQDIYGIFLQMLTDGRLQDKKGKMADFSNAIIIFTSNAGAHDIVDVFNSGRHPEPEELKSILRASQHFKDEFLGRVDSAILPFKPISEEVARLILGIHLKKFQKIMRANHNVDMTIDDSVVDHLLEVGFSPIYGARPLKNAIRSILTPFLADKLIRGDIAKNDDIELTMTKDGDLSFTKKTS